MSKKAFKVASAAAVAASAFVAVNPAQAATAAEADVLVKKAESLGGTLKWAISVEGSWDGHSNPDMKLFNDTKAAHAKAVTAVSSLPAGSQKTALQTRLNDKVKLYVDRAVTVIDAVSAGKKIEGKKMALETQLDASKIDSATVKAYDDLSAEIRKQESLLSRVYGQTSRASIRDYYQKSAEAVKAEAKYPVSVLVELGRLDAAITAKNLTEATTRYTNISDWLPKVENATMKAELQAQFDAKKSAYEALKAPKIESVSAIDASTIEIKFNQAMEKGTGTNGAENIANYIINTTALSATDTAELSEDGKTVTLTLNTSADLTNDTAYTVTVDKDIKTVSGKVLGTVDHKTSLFFADHVKPTVQSVAAQANGDVKITFSEKVAAGTPSVVINGKTVAPSAVSGNTVTVTKANLTLSGANLENGKSYSVYVNGYNDLVPVSPNAMSLYVGSFTYNVVADVTAPSVSSLVAKDAKTLTLTFSEAISGANTDGTTNNATVLNLVVKKGSSVITTTATTTDGKTFTLNLDQTTNVLYDSTKNETSAVLNVTVKGYKDASLNIGTETSQNVTVTNDVTAPAFVKSEYDYANTNFVLTFSEGLKADAVKTALAAGITIVDSNGVLQTQITAAEIKNIATGDKTITIDNSNATGLDLPAGTYTFSFTKELIKDQALNGGIGNAAFSTTVTVPATAPGSDSGKPTVTSVTNGAKDVFTVLFSEAVKGGSVAGSATDAFNYRLNGAPLPAGTVITLDSLKTTATITLPAGSVSKSETQLFNVWNVQDLAGNVLDTTTKTVAVLDSVKPELLSAKVDADGALVLSFSENISNAVSTVDFVAADFEVKVNGADVTEALAAGVNSNELKITASDASFAAGTITVKVLDTAVGTDGNGNVVKTGTSVTATR
ncbi:Ig-like domain-containing protein [Fictibacillus sp. 18YEL24]|uniref:Ig-like domain-containing protein n=1 Tax=Fictibacillus sp. 18YEL24 TaxID=2745875 RepID=UPI0018CD7A13|nr:Ig-like domain-containing protein [Fictibacillus sp. 18YEL24]MBH0169293.1 Ig-like domain-containing protein [Fictibacillus sp. 18YEL24]